MPYSRRWLLLLLEAVGTPPSLKVIKINSRSHADASEKNLERTFLDNMCDV